MSATTCSHTQEVTLYNVQCVLARDTELSALPTFVNVYYWLCVNRCSLTSERRWVVVGSWQCQANPGFPLDWKWSRNYPGGSLQAETQKEMKADPFCRTSSVFCYSLTAPADFKGTAVVYNPYSLYTIPIKLLSSCCCK